MVSKQPFTKSRRFVVSLAVSADGFIARLDGSVDWLDRPWPKHHYGMDEFQASIDTVLMGGRTYREAASRGGGFGSRKTKSYVFTHTPPPTAPKGVEFVNEPVDRFAARLRAQPGKDVWIMGGGGIIASFVDANEVDDFIFHVVPTFIGEGIPLIAPARRMFPLKLQDAKAYEDGVVRLHYTRTCPANRAAGAGERATASEPRERSAPAQRRARERVGESEGRSPSDERRRGGPAALP
jgi:dihydrofolate reductase